MAKSDIRIEGFVANEITFRDANGKQVVDVSVPVTPQKKDEQTGRWEDTGETVWYRASFWEDHAQVVAQTVEKGSLVWLAGTGIKIDQYSKKDGTPGVNLSITNPTIARIAQKPRRGSSVGSTARSNAASDEPWAATAPKPETGAQSADVWNDETPW